MAADLVQRRVAVIAATGSTLAASTAKLATTTIPIVFGAGSDPVKEGLVASLNRLGGNITGVTPFTQQLGAKQLELLHAMIPTAAMVAVLGKRNDPDTESQLKDVEAAARTLRLQILALTVDSKRDFQAAFATLVQRGAGALIIFSGPFFTANRVQLAILAARHGIPAIYTLREFPLAGGLMSYATRLTDSYRQVGVYVGQILQGAKPANLPIMQPTKFEFVINLETAQTLGLTPPPSLLAIADEVIE
jgi:putative ABC transport system substrate-binding protein